MHYIGIYVVLFYAKKYYRKEVKYIMNLLQNLTNCKLLLSTTTIAKQNNSLTITTEYYHNVQNDTILRLYRLNSITTLTTLHDTKIDQLFILEKLKQDNIYTLDHISSGLLQDLLEYIQELQTPIYTAQELSNVVNILHNYATILPNLCYKQLLITCIIDKLNMLLTLAKEENNYKS